MLNLNLHYLGKLEECVKIKDDDAVAAMWNELLRYIDVSYIKRHWANQETESYIFIATSITQAFEYFKASKVTTLKTRPLLLYYSFLNLIKAVLFMVSEKKPSDYHGLCNTDFSQDIEKMSAKTNNGIFTELGRLLECDIKVGELITLADCCDNAIEVYWDFCHYFKRQPKIIVPSVDVWSKGQIDITFKDNVDAIKKTTRVLQDFEVVEDSGKLKLKNKKMLNRDKIFEDGSALMKRHFDFSVFVDDAYYLNINPLERRIPGIMAYYGILYLLGNLVRYKPERLYDILEDKDTSIRWFINKLCDTSERVYPNLVLNILYGSNIKFVKY